MTMASGTYGGTGDSDVGVAIGAATGGIVAIASVGIAIGAPMERKGGDSDLSVAIGAATVE